MKRFLVHFDAINDTMTCKTEKEARNLAKSVPHANYQIYEEWSRQDLFGNIEGGRTLVTEFTPNLPSNEKFRIINSYDIRQCKKKYCLQKYNPEAKAWQNYKLSNDIEELCMEVNK